DNAQNCAPSSTHSSPPKLSAAVNAGGPLALSVSDPSHGNAATAVTATVNQFSFNPSVTTTFLDPNHNGHVTAADLQGDVSRVVGLTTAGAFSAQLTVSGGLPGLGALGTATIGVNDTNVFSG